MLLVLGFMVYKQNNNIVELQCQEYEAKGYIGKGNCKCAEKIYTSWNEAYDLMDACYILNTKMNR